MKKTTLILLVLIVVLATVQTGSAWYDEFNSDTLANYVYEPSVFFYNSSVPQLNMTNSGVDGELFRDTTATGVGWYNWTFKLDDNQNPIGMKFGSSAKTTGGYSTTGNNYCVFKFAGTTWRIRENGGAGNLAGFVLDPLPPNNDDTGWTNLSVFWDPDAVADNIKIYIDNTYTTSATSNVYTSGYFGIFKENGIAGLWATTGYLAFNGSLGGPAPTPTPTPTPAPWLPCTKNDNITIEKGETWIKWNWSYTENITPFIIDYYNVYLNGTLYRSNYTHNYLNLPDIGSNSYQILEVWGMNTTYCNCSQNLYSAVRSDPAYVWWYLVIGIGLLTVGYFVPIFGFLAIIILLLGFYMVYQEYNQSYIVLTYALAAVIAMIVTAMRFAGGKK